MYDVCMMYVACMFNVCLPKCNCLIYNKLIYIQCMLYWKDASFCIMAVHGSLDIKVLTPKGRRCLTLLCLWRLLRNH